MPGCQGCGEHKAPKHRALNEYYHFCFDHIKEYNTAWNFFQGMSEAEIQSHIVDSVYGFRPTRRYDADGQMAERLREAAWQTYHSRKKNHAGNAHSPKNSARHLKWRRSPLWSLLRP